MMERILDVGALASPLHDAVETDANTHDDLLGITADAAGQRAMWEHIINDTLIEWGLNPESLEEDDLVPPTERALQVAGVIAIAMRKAGQPAPMRVVPDRDGGIAFERWEGDTTVTIMISADGAVEVLHWIGSKIDASQSIG